MPTGEELMAIMALAIKAVSRCNDAITKQQAETVLKWNEKVLEQKARARVIAREYKRNHKKGAKNETN